MPENRSGAKGVARENAAGLDLRAERAPSPCCRAGVAWAEVCRDLGPPDPRGHLGRMAAPPSLALDGTPERTGRCTE